MEPVEVISEAHLKVILENLIAEDIIEPAFDEWIPCRRTGHTILNLENGKIEGVGVEFNEITMLHIPHIKLFTIEAENQGITPEELFSFEEHEKYLDFKDDDPCEYTPDIVSHFCKINEINEKKRTITILANKYEQLERFNYNMWESRILEEYYDIIL